MKELIQKIENLTKALLFKKDEIQGRLQDGTLLRWSGELGEGTEVFAITDTGEIPLTQGAWEMEDGRVLIIEGTAIKQMLTQEQNNKTKMDELKTQIMEELKAFLSTEINTMKESLKVELSKVEAPAPPPTPEPDPNKALIEKVEALLSAVGELQTATPNREVAPIATPNNPLRDRAFQLGLAFSKK